jgi:hypothetical protein
MVPAARVQPLKPTRNRIARKADKATAPVAQIANKTLKLLCMISIQVRFKKVVRSIAARLKAGNSYSIGVMRPASTWLRREP